MSLDLAAFGAAFGATAAAAAPAQPLTARAGGALAGSAIVPGDKSISHRALILGALAVGRTEITGLLEGEDVLHTAAAVRSLGAKVQRQPGSEPGSGPRWSIDGCGVGGLEEPADVLDFGNSGTGARLMLGVLAGHRFNAFLTGDASLRSRPMDRVTVPLARMGAGFLGREDGRLPMAVLGTDQLIPIRYEMPMASAQVKSALLLAGLNTLGETTVVEPLPTRDHTERMLRGFGAEVRVRDQTDDRRAVTIVGQPELRGRPVVVPADPSSAAFPTVAALLVEGSEIRLPGVGINPLRFGLYQTLKEMGADIQITNQKDAAGESTADLLVRHSRLKGVEVPAGRVPKMIDEYPILAVAAALADGPTRMNGLGELRVKESNRLLAMAQGLEACGVTATVDDDSLVVQGGAGRPPAGGVHIATRLDHRIAMAFLVLGLATRAPVTIDDARPITTSFPLFQRLMTGLGADIAAPDTPPTETTEEPDRTVDS